MKHHRAWGFKGALEGAVEDGGNRDFGGHVGSAKDNHGLDNEHYIYNKSYYSFTSVFVP
ncbi:MAG: hypothetical protein IPP25_14920 [Saprospiraceae bacterium]|nr:hypothetical protein [Candidatus Opimibacter skivensis]